MKDLRFVRGCKRYPKFELPEGEVFDGLLNTYEVWGKSLKLYGLFEYSSVDGRIIIEASYSKYGCLHHALTVYFLDCTPSRKVIKNIIKLFWGKELKNHGLVFATPIGYEPSGFLYDPGEIIDVYTIMGRVANSIGVIQDYISPSFSKVEIWQNWRHA